MRSNNEDVPVLVAQAGPLNGQRWPLRSSLLVGREPVCDIVIPDRQVSRQHARLQPSVSGVLLEDLDSKNGTHCNGQPIFDPWLLQDGDVIQIALVQQFVYLSSDATLPLDVEDLDFHSAQPAFAEAPAGRLRLEKKSRRVWIAGQEIIPPLSVSQFGVLELLYERQGQVVSRRELTAAVWGDMEALEVSEQALDALIRRLRERLASLDPTFNYIVTVRGHGLRLDSPPAD